jgi:hypothetical protein
MMRLRNSLAAGAMLCAAAGSAHATTVSIDSELVYNGSNNAPVFGTVAPVLFTPLFNQNQVGSVSGVTRSPYETNTNGTTLTAYSVLSAGGQPGPGSSATYNVSSTSFEILWGSPDTYNFATFYSGANGTGSVIGSFSGASLSCYPTTCNSLAWDDVVFGSTGGSIGSVVLADSGQAAFEFGLNPARIGGTPLPAAVWMFGSVIAGAAGVSRLRRKAKA